VSLCERIQEEDESPVDEDERGAKEAKSSSNCCLTTLSLSLSLSLEMMMLLSCHPPPLHAIIRRWEGDVFIER